MKTTLKLLLSALFIATISFNSFAQDAFVELMASQIDSNNKTEMVENEKPALSPKQIYLNHTEMATNQFSKHLALHITYPDNLKKQCVEGDVIVEVLLNKQGEIKNATIYKSLHTSFDQLVLTKIQAMEKINLNSYEYKGARRLRIPVNFSLR